MFTYPFFANDTLQESMDPQAQSVSFYTYLVTLASLAVCALAATRFTRLVWTALNDEGTVPILRCKDSDLSRYLTDNVPGLTLPYMCPLWARGAHWHTVAAMIFPPMQHHYVTLRYQREHLQMKDRGVVGLDWAISELRPDLQDSPLILVIPGFSLDIQSTLRASGDALVKGFRPVVFRSRGTFGLPLFTPKLQSPGDGTDLRQVVRYLRAKYPRSPVTAMSLGAGSGTLLSYLGEFGSSAHVSGAVLVSPVWDIQDMVQRVPRPYVWFELMSAKLCVLRHKDVLSKVVDAKEVLRSADLRQVSERVHFPVYGLSDMEEFWEKNSPLRDVDDISVPVVAIRSLDDPFSCPLSAPMDVFSVYPNFMLVSVDRGGHCGFLEGECYCSWATKVAVHCLRVILNFEGNGSSNMRT